VIHLEGNTVRQTGNGAEKIWSIPELLEIFDALSEEPLDERIMLFRQIVPLAQKMHGDLSETARLCCDFWQNLQPWLIESRKYEYTVTISDTYRWALEVGAEGLFFKDISGQYGTAGEIRSQLLSDFWFYGPLMPLPGLETRKQVLAQIQNAFERKGDTLYDSHFQLFEYPSFISPPMWEEGDYRVSDFVIMRDFGVDYGRQNFRDGLVSLGFISFEQCLHRSDIPEWAIPAKVLREIKNRLLGIENPEPEEVFSEKIIEEKPAQKTPETETEWLEIGAYGNDRDKQEAARVLWENYRNEKSVEILLGLLPNPDAYWRDYVFNTFAKMPDSEAVRDWILKCLNGDNAFYFRKSVDVLRMWGLFGNPRLNDENLLRPLNWAEKEMHSVAFREALKKVSNILVERS
jgi:hypothetical protein